MQVGKFHNSPEYVYGPERDKAADKVRDFKARGMSYPQMAEQIDLTPQGLYLAVNRPTKGMRRSTYEKIQKLQFVSWDFSPGKLRAIRESHGMSRRELAQRAGINESTIIYWEGGRCLPRRNEKFSQVLQILGAETSDVMGQVVEDHSEDHSDGAFEMPPLFEGVKVADDYIMAGYPCCVCGREFQSRSKLATHPHPKRESRV